MDQSNRLNSDETQAARLIKTEALTRVYTVGAQEVQALRGVDLDLDAGKLVALRGRSGSGKTTLLNCLGGLDEPTAGHIWFQGQDLANLTENQRVELRRRQIGFVFQSHALLMTYSALENVTLMLRLAGVNRRQRHERAREVLELVGLTKWLNHRPFELSGGQQQRVAIARAIATRPALILADEPTGELDSATGQQILQLFHHIVDWEGATVLIATHDLAVDAFADEVIHLEDGRIANSLEQIAA